MRKSEIVNIYCPGCATPMVAAYKGRNIEGELLHKCGKCKRYWKVDYTNEKIIWIEGKESYTPTKEFKLDLSKGES